MAVRTVEVPVADLQQTVEANKTLIEAVRTLSDLADHTSDPDLARTLRGQVSKILASAETIAKVVVSAAHVAA